MAKSVASKIDKEIGRRIQQRRRELGLSADTLAEKIGVSQQQFSRYERGKAKINAGHLADIAVVLDTPIGWFFSSSQGDNPDSMANGRYVPIYPDELKIRLDFLWDKLNREQKRNLVNLMDSMVRD